MLLDSQKYLRQQQAEFANTTSELEAQIATLEKKLADKIMENSNYHMRLAEITCQLHTLRNDNFAKRSRLQLLENSHSTVEQEHDSKVVKLEAVGNSTQGQDKHAADAKKVEDKQQIANATIEICSKYKPLLNNNVLSSSVDSGACAANAAAF